MDNVVAEKLDAEIESAQEDRKERRSKVQQQLQLAMQQEQEEQKVRQMTFS